MSNISKIILSISFTLLLLPLSSCDSWLDIKPENNLIADEYWKKEEDVLSAIGGLNNALRNNLMTYFAWGAMRGGYLRPGEYNANNGEGNFMKGVRNVVNNQDYNSNNAVFNWGGIYGVISKANFIIKRTPDVLEEDLSFTQNEANQFIAEARFARALMYFYLIRTFYEVPLVTEPFEDDNRKFTQPAVSQENVLEQIHKDLEFAEKHCPEQYEKIAVTKGRATKGAVRALLADIYLWEERYDDCLAAIDRLEQQNMYGLLKASEWFKNFNPGNTNESIFELQFDQKLEQKGKVFDYFESDSKFFNLNTEFLEDISALSSLDVRGEYGTLVSKEKQFPILWKYYGKYGAKKDTDVRPDDDRAVNWIMYRYAEIVLMKAEAYAYKGNFDDAWNELNRIISRADGEVHQNKPNDIDILLNEILHERAIELAFEGKRWFDVFRLAKADNFKRKDLAINVLLKGVKNVTERTLLQNRLKNPLSFYLPISQSELNTNPELEQNPYYKGSE
ncbi:MAG: RagB/SusD family nutrient uptake outer membrane protein [Cytophagales bacterium]|nr:RagB/SusD family nutrient uptake outer membrane protein [Cytophagales bacterium]